MGVTVVMTEPAASRARLVVLPMGKTVPICVWARLWVRLCHSAVSGTGMGKNAVLITEPMGRRQDRLLLEQESDVIKNKFAEM